MTKRLTAIILLICITLGTAGLLISLGFYGQTNTFCRDNAAAFSSYEECKKMGYADAIDAVCIANPSYSYTFRFDSGEEKTVGCREIKENGYEKLIMGSYPLVMYSDGKIYVKFSKEEVVAGKASGRYCMNSSEVFDNINATRCINLTISSTRCSDSNCIVESTISEHTIELVFEEYNSQMSNIFSGRYYTGKKINAFGVLAPNKDGISIRINSESEQITSGYTPIDGDGTFTVREDPV